MALTLAEMIAEVRLNIKRPTGAFPDARITTRLNWAQEYLAGLHSFRELRKVYTRTTVEDQKRYGFPQRMRDIISLVLEDGSSSRRLEYVKPITADKANPYPESLSTGSPVMFIDFGSNFELDPIPDSSSYTLILRCNAYADDLSESGDESSYDRKDDLLVAIATGMCYESIREFEDATYWHTNVVPRLLAQAISNDKSDRSWQPVMRPFSLTSKSRNYRVPIE